MGAKVVNHTRIPTMDLPLSHQTQCALGYQALLVAMLQSILFSSLKKSKSVLEETQNGGVKKLHKKDQHVYNNYYELRSRAINKKAK